MKYRILIIKPAVKELRKINQKDYERIKAAIYSLAQNPWPPGSRNLTGRNGWRIRVGNYRVIYEINKEDLIVLIIHVGHRRDVYR